MNRATHIQVFEQETLRIDGTRFTVEHLDALLAFNEKHRQKYFTLVHRGVKFRQYVGVLKVGDLTIEILPKTDRDNTNQYWRKFLVSLLYECDLLSVNTLSRAPLALDTSPLLWIYIELFIKEVEQLLGRGLYKNYQTKEVETKVWKGQVNFSKTYTKRLHQPLSIRTRAQVYDYEHLYHQLIYQALETVQQFWISTSLQDRISYLLGVFPKQKRIAIRKEQLQQLSFQDKNKSYKKVLELVQIILLQYSPALRAGAFPTLAILFDMNQLFEQYIYRQLKKELHGSDTIAAQISRPFWAEKQLRPDIFLRHKGKQYILDTKWKVLQKASPSEEDLRQLYAYNINFGAEQGLLVYPNVFDLANRIAPFAVQQGGKEHFGQVAFVNVMNAQGELNDRIGKELLALLV